MNILNRNFTTISLAVTFVSSLSTPQTLLALLPPLVKPPVTSLEFYKAATDFIAIMPEDCIQIMDELKKQTGENGPDNEELSQLKQTRKTCLTYNIKYPILKYANLTAYIDGPKNKVDKRLKDTAIALQCDSRYIADDSIILNNRTYFINTADGTLFHTKPLNVDEDSLLQIDIPQGAVLVDSIETSNFEGKGIIFPSGLFNAIGAINAYISMKKNNPLAAVLKIIQTKLMALCTSLTKEPYEIFTPEECAWMETFEDIYSYDTPSVKNALDYVADVLNTLSTYMDLYHQKGRSQFYRTLTSLRFHIQQAMLMLHKPKLTAASGNTTAAVPASRPDKPVIPQPLNRKLSSISRVHVASAASSAATANTAAYASPLQEKQNPINNALNATPAKKAAPNPFDASKDQKTPSAKSSQKKPKNLSPTAVLTAYIGTTAAAAPAQGATAQPSSTSAKNKGNVRYDLLTNTAVID